MIYYVNRIISHDKTFECYQFHTDTDLFTKLEVASVYINTLMYMLHYSNVYINIC